MSEVLHYNTVYEGYEAEIVEKKSRFIATVFHVETEEEIETILESMRKKYWNATHNCYAYVLGKRSENMRCSDDGEPQGTAGKPMLDVLTGRELTDVLVVVTRYFGGTLLGTGGLVRAYSKAVAAGLDASELIEKKLSCMLQIETDYTGLGKIQYLLMNEGLTLHDTEYAENVKVLVPVPVEELEKVKSLVTEGTNGRAVMTELAHQYYGMIGKEMILFDPDDAEE